MDIDTVKYAFAECQYPFYKDLEIHEDKATCTLYSIKSDYRKTITLDISNYGALLHQLSIELIKLRSQEFIATETTINDISPLHLSTLD